MPRHLKIWTVLALVGAVLGCANKKTVVDPSFTIPEGIASAQLELITYYDQSTSKIRMVDRAPLGRVNIGGTNFDSIAVDAFTNQLAITPVRSEIPGVVRGFVLNRTGAEGIEVFRTEPNGAVRRILDFAVPVTRRWIDGGSEYYEFTDSDPSRTANATYYVRGLINGVGGASSPVSNGSRPTDTRLNEISYLAERWGTARGGRPEDSESTFFMVWTPVTGASRYIIHVFEYQPRSLSLRERILTGAPSPVVTIGARDIFVASVPASPTSYKLGDPLATIYTYRTPRRLTDYYVRISAVDAAGRMIGMTTGIQVARTSDLNRLYLFPLDNTVKDFFVDFSDPEVVGASPPAYLLYSRGAFWVNPGIDPNPAVATKRGR